jgi:hypothetical protein
MIEVRGKMKALFHSMIAPVPICELGDKWAWVFPQGIKCKPIVKSK